MLTKHILVAENEKHMCLSLSIILRRAGYTVTLAENGRKALEKILEFNESIRPVDLLITDVQMPGLTGMELIARLDELHIPLPVLIISGFACLDTAAGANRKRCLEFIEKPFSAEHLIESIAKALDKGVSAEANSRSPSDIINAEKDFKK